MSRALKTLSPKPNITRVARSWNVPPGMVFAVAEDAEGQIWIVESTPVGTHCWTVEQASELPQGTRTRRALQAAIRLGRRLQYEYASTSISDSISEGLTLPDMLPRFPGEAGEVRLDAPPAHSGSKVDNKKVVRQAKVPASV